MFAPAKTSGGYEMSASPSGIHPESGTRLPLPRLEDMDDYGKQVYDKVVGAGAASVAGIRGPWGITLHSPGVAEAEKQMSQYFRLKSGLAGPMRELAVLIAAREMNSQFVWSAHEPVALKEGLSKETVDAVKYRKDVAGLPEAEAVLILLGRDALNRRLVPEKTYARAMKVFTPKQLVDLIAVMGSFVAVALKLYVFDMQLPEHMKPLLPLP
jgi:4-carboxymuconolactone decarboxylase